LFLSDCHYGKKDNATPSCLHPRAHLSGRPGQPTLLSLIAQRQAARLRPRGFESIAEVWAYEHAVSAPREIGAEPGRSALISAKWSTTPLPFLANLAHTSQLRSSCTLRLPRHCSLPTVAAAADPMFPRDHALASTTNSRNCDVFVRKPRTPTICAAPYPLASLAVWLQSP